MIPLNTKSLFAHLCIQMDRLDKSEIDSSTASAQASLVGQAVNILNYELKRSVILSEKKYTENIRNVEGKNFDSLPFLKGEVVKCEIVEPDKDVENG